SLQNSKKLTEDELKEVLEFLRNCDNRNKGITKHYFLVGIERVIKERYDAFFFEKIYNAFDVDGSGDVDLMEISAGLSHLLRGSTTDMVRMVYDLFDVNNSGGQVKQEEMVDFFKKFAMGQAKMSGYEYTSHRARVLEDHLTVIFKATDLDNNGSLDFEEFMKAVSDVDHPLGMLLLDISGNNVGEEKRNH
ncbi:hypothetical protein AKO1_013804, partial [Acrasis kona]